MTKVSNSKLVNYTRISPNRTSPRSKKIDTISIHCVVGQCSVETLGSVFAPSSRQASSNYGIGADGRIGMYVEEKDRSWCTSSSANDNRAITIEVASNTYAPYWVNDKAMRSLINLLTDICKRNDIKELKWKADKSLIGQVDKQNMTVHRWFANKDCPGDYLYGKHGYIASEVNIRLKDGVLCWGCEGEDVKDLQKRLVSKGYSIGSAGIDGEFGDSTEKAVMQYQKDNGLESDGVVGDMTWKSLKGYTSVTANKLPNPNTPTQIPIADKEKFIYEWLCKNTTLNTAAISGILSNLYTESGFDPKNLQNSYESSLGYTDETYTRAVDEGKYKNFVEDAAGYGLAQWTYYTRKQGLYDYAKSKNKSIGDMEMQLEYLIKELKSSTTLWKYLNNVEDTPEGAYQSGYKFCYDFEKPANIITNSTTRGQNAKKYFTKYYETKEVPKSEESPKLETIYDGIDVGDILDFTGTKQYASADAVSPKKATPGKVKVTQKYKENSKHPIHVRSVDDNGKFISGVYGWVNFSDLDIIEFKPYLVKVTATKLNYRRGPGITYKVQGVIEDKGTYTIVQEKNGWGQLKSKVGWINLKYTKKV